jgi:hypothetical protein
MKERFGPPVYPIFEIQFVNVYREPFDAQSAAVTMTWGKILDPGNNTFELPGTILSLTEGFLDHPRGQRGGGSNTVGLEYQ